MAFCPRLRLRGPRWRSLALLVLVATSGAAAAGDRAAGHGVHYVYLVRHGAYDRVESAHDDRTGNGLNAKGHEQARLAGARLANLGVRFDRFVSSELLRAKETADDIGAVLHKVPARDAALNECTPTTFEAPTPRNEACDAARAAEWARYFAPTPARDTFDLVVSHGNVIRWDVMRALGADTRNWIAQDSANASLTIIAVTADGRPHLVAYDDVGHLPLALQTWSGEGAGAKAR